MKKIFLFTITLVISAQSFSQATKQKATLFFKDGTQLSCFARIAGDYIRYAEDKTKNDENKANYNELDSLHIWMNDQKLKLTYKTEEGNEVPKLMEKIISGSMNLYRISNVYEKNIGFHSQKDYLNRKTSSTVYFLESKDNQNTVFRFTKNFNTNAKEYFADCPKLVNKIGEDGFRKKDIFEIVLFYNENCN